MVRLRSVIRFRGVQPLHQIPVPLDQLLPSHLFGDDVAVRVVGDQAPLLFQPLVECGGRNRLQHAHHGEQDAVSLDKVELLLEDGFVVVIEADDEVMVLSSKKNIALVNKLFKPED